ncbi:MAG: hypothetical protein AAF960_28865 [Bacteroidota bacterium]
MNLKKIQAYITLFKQHLQGRYREDVLYKWESLANFQKNWDLSATDLTQMYDQSLQNQQTVRLWKANQYFPKQIMLLFCDLQPEYVRFAFQDLFNEEKSIDGRMDRFVFYCDELLNAYKEKYPLKIENHHYHHYRIISLYLAFRYPEQYALYDFELFKHTLINLGSRDIPKLNDVERFFKISRTLWKFLSKDETVWALHQRRLRGEQYFKGHSLLLANEFCEQV